MSFRSPASPLLLLSTLALAVSCSDRDPTSPSGTRFLSRFDAPASAEGTRNIRIGVVQSATSISLGSASEWTITDKSSGVELLSGSGGNASITFLAAPPAFLRLQVTCSNAAAVATKRAAADAAGYVTLTEF